MDIQLGCMPRPWSKLPHAEALAGISAAGFKYYAFLGHRESTADADTPPEVAEANAAEVRRHGLEPCAIFSATRLEASEDEALQRVKHLIDNAARVNTPILIEGGTSRPEKYEQYLAVMRRAAPYAQERGITFALKPHGGIATTGDDCVRAVQAVNHPAYRICFDPGNLLYYAGQDPVAELPKLAPYVVAMCIKDETGSDSPQRTVDVTPGDGDVDFAGVFRILADNGFAGKPAIVETLGSGSLEEVNHQAKRAYHYLTQVLAST